MMKENSVSEGLLYSHSNGHYHPVDNVFILGDDPTVCNLTIEDKNIGHFKIRLVQRIIHKDKDVQYFIENIGSSNKEILVDGKIIPAGIYLLISMFSVIKVGDLFFILCHKRLPICEIEKLIEQSINQPTIAYDVNIIKKTLELKKRLISYKAKVSDINRLLKNNFQEKNDPKLDRLNLIIKKLENDLIKHQKIKQEYLKNLEINLKKNSNELFEIKKQLITNIQAYEKSISELVSSAYSISAEEQLEFCA